MWDMGLSKNKAIIKIFCDLFFVSKRQVLLKSVFKKEVLLNRTQIQAGLLP
jgi:hypothetical protein